jgi:hypothetical protein
VNQQYILFGIHVNNLKYLSVLGDTWRCEELWGCTDLGSHSIAIRHLVKTTQILAFMSHRLFLEQ